MTTATTAAKTMIKVVKAKRSLAGRLAGYENRGGASKARKGPKQHGAAPLSTIDIVNVLRSKPSQKEIKRGKKESKNKKSKKREAVFESILSQSMVAEADTVSTAELSLPLPGAVEQVSSAADSDDPLVKAVAPAAGRDYLKAATPSKYQSKDAKQVRRLLSSLILYAFPSLTSTPTERASS